MKKKIKILVAYHKPAQLVADDIFTPIHLGRAIAQNMSKDGELSGDICRWMSENMIGDDTGDNISNRNREFCELTAMYWAWKNYDRLGNPDYIGLMHYRRFLIFNDSYAANRQFDFCNMNRIDFAGPNYKGEIGLEYGKIEAALAEMPAIVSCNELPYSNADFIKQGFILNPDMVFDTICREYRHLAPHLKDYLASKTHYWSNMFVCERKIFFEYCEWLFDALFKLDKMLIYEDMSIGQKRQLAYIAEDILSGLYWTYARSKGIELSSKHISFIEHSDIEQDMAPSFDNAAAIAFVCDEKYAKYAIVAIRSIIDRADENKNYDIFVLGKNLRDDYRRAMSEMAAGRRNIRIRYADVQSAANRHGLDGTLLNQMPNVYNEMIYYRYMIPEIINGYDKVLYMDSDIVAMDDMAKLYDFDIGDNLIGAVRDIEVRRWLKNPDLREEVISRNKSVGIADSKNYFNSGVMLMNTKKMRQANTLAGFVKLADKFRNMPNVFDQEIINAVAYGDVKYLPTECNIENIVQIKVKNWETELDQESVENYKRALKNMMVLHFCDRDKPWSNAQIPFADIWWRHARKTPFYESCLQNLCHCIAAFEIQSRAPGPIQHIDITRFRRKILKYKILQFLTLGTVREFRKRKNDYRHQII
jgi:lipopolysaccharide biosynthesis glycosyltransferase